MLRNISSGFYIIMLYIYVLFSVGYKPVPMAVLATFSCTANKDGQKCGLDI